MSINDGGPAFPHDGQQNYTGGMTLRDYFAARAMQSIVSLLYAGIRASDLDLMARDAYAIADAMLKAREAV